jgi:hypothetical protein
LQLQELSNLARPCLFRGQARRVSNHPFIQAGSHGREGNLDGLRVDNLKIELDDVPNGDRAGIG